MVVATALTILSRNSEKPTSRGKIFGMLQDSLIARTYTANARGTMTITSWMTLKKQRQLLQAMQRKDSLEFSDIKTIQEIDRQLNQMLYEH